MNNRVEPGQPIRKAFSARAWNRAQDAADRILDGHVPPGIADPVGVRTQSFVPILVENTLSTGVDRWGCLSIAGIAITPSGATGEATRSFESTPVLRGGLPTAGEPFVVPLEPIAASGIGRAAVHGVTPVRLEVVDTSHDRCDAKDGSTTGLKSGTDGPAEILWKESGTGSKWALVRFGGAAAGGVRLGKVTGTWSKGATASVTQWKGDGSAAVTGPSGAMKFTAINRAQTITGPTGGYWVGVELIDQTWHLEWAECNE